MNIVELVYAPYFLKFKKPFSTSKGSFAGRKGFIINLKNANGITGVGDSSPFPEFGSETYEQTEEALTGLKIELKVDLDKIQESISSNLSSFNQLPALRHGIEQALLDLISKEKNLPIEDLLKRKTKNEILINGVINYQPAEETAGTALKLKAEGFSSIKLKAGRDNFEDDYKCIQAARNAAGYDIKLRIDVNGKWNLEEAKKHLDSLEKFNIEYVEQPVSSLTDFIALKKTSSIPLAADESLRTKENAFDFIRNKALDVFILKPMMLGGLIPTLEIIDAAFKNDVKAVITSSFESAIGRSMAILAASVIPGETAHGLNTSVYFEKDLIPEKYPVKNGRIAI